MPVRMGQADNRAVLEAAGLAAAGLPGLPAGLPGLPRRNVSRGGQRAAVREGLDFQRRAMADAYRAGLNIFEIPNGARWLGGGRMAGVKTPFDIGGCIPWQRGRGIFFDCKRVGPDDRGSGFAIDRAKPHQLNNLEALGKGGAVAGLLVKAEPIGQVRWLDWRQFRHRGSIVPWAELARWYVLNHVNADTDFRLLTEMLNFT